MSKIVRTEILWSSPSLWNEAQEAFRLSLDRPTKRLDAARRQAAAIAHQFDLLSDWFDDLAVGTCRVCPDPCCRHAMVWLDFRDLLFIHLQGEFLPPQQLRRDRREPCRYLGYRGCSLPRHSRPWICTWYICPLQRQALMREIPFGLLHITAAGVRIKARRAAMEAAFLTALGFAPGEADTPPGDQAPSSVKGP